MRVARYAICWVTTALLVSACSSSSEPSTSTEPLPVTSATVQAAFNHFADSFALAATCGAGLAVNCPNGTAGAPIHIPLAITAYTITQHDAPDTLVFDWTADVKVVTPGIPITIPSVGACTLTIDTRAGTDTTLHVVGTATFSQQTAGGVIDRLDLTSESVTGLAVADFTISGSFNCDVANGTRGAFLDALSNVFTRTVSLCSATGPALFEVCKQP